MKTGVLKIEIVSDVVCPWCFIGKRRLEKALTLISRPSEVNIAWKPFELNPGLPKEGVDRKQYMMAKFGDLEEVEAIHNHVRQAAASAGLDFEFDHIARVPNTFDAHRLIGFSGQAGLQNQVVEGLFRAVFLEGKFIGDHEVLSKIGASAGLARSKVKDFLASDDGADNVRSEIREAIQRGVQGVPNFRINNRYVIGGAQPPEVIAEFLNRAVSTSA
ncbi:MAG TPA: DsbA family oxidoreductase [Nitrospiria bacterium]|nr:DsbA family oxidoreductase [Nitrospiria bacterium]